jgi:predicted ATPase
VEVETKSINVLFGPNGTGKSTFLDTIQFVSDCAVDNIEAALSSRSHGFGALWDGASRPDSIFIKLETDLAMYEISFKYYSAPSNVIAVPYVGEILDSKKLNIRLIDREVGKDETSFYQHDAKKMTSRTLREPKKLALTRYLDFEESSEATEVDTLLRSVHFYESRAIDFRQLKKFGSESSHHTRLQSEGRNLWSVLRNLHDRRSVDERYNTIVNFMNQGFPAFKDLLIEQTGPNVVYGSLIEEGRRQPIPASGMSDGHIQMLTLLTALFSDGKNYDALVLFDEPETSFHPYALHVFAQAVKLAAKEWNKQVFIATHSPVLISQFDLENVLAMGIDESGQTVIQRVSEMDEIKDLLEKYATGSLYMAEAIAPQSKLVVEKSA